MKYFSFLFSLFLITIFLVGCGTEQSKMVIATAGDEDITLGDFERAYEKNSGESTSVKADSASIMKFWDLYRNFRLKLIDGKAKGYDTNKDLTNELADYKKKVGVSYMLEKQLLDPGIKNIYDKRKVEYRVSHIMIRLDSLTKEQAKDKAQEVIDKIKAGEKFEDLAKKYSDDFYSKNSGGDIYYITFGQTLPEFDEAVYKTQVDSIYPYPVETKFGYHVIKVTDKQNRKYKVKVEHIMLDFVDSVGNIDTALAQKQIEEIRKDIMDKKISFEDAAKKYSDDKGSAEKGGDLGFFERRSMVLPFDETAFNMKPGDISNIVKTKFGFHIIKFIEEQPMPSFEESKAELKNMYKNSLYTAKYDSLIAELKVKYNYNKNTSAIDFILSKTDSNKFNNDYWESDFRKAVKDTAIFTLTNAKVGLDSVLNYVINDVKYQNKLIDKKTLNDAVDETSKNVLLEQKAANLEEIDPEFAQLMKEYKQGIFIFKIQEEEIWNKIKLDSTKMVEFYENTKENYKVKDGADFSEIFAKKDSVINSLYAQLEAGADFDSLAKTSTERYGYKAKKGAYGMMDVEVNELARIAFNIKNEGEYTKPVEVKGGYSIIRLNKKRHAGIKTFEEAKAEVASLYQEKESKRLEEEYINQLNQKYPINNFNQDVLLKAFKAEK